MARSLVEHTGASAVAIVVVDAAHGRVLGRFCEPMVATDVEEPFCLEGSPFDGLPAEPGLFLSAVPATLCGISLDPGNGVLLAASAEVSAGRRVVVAAVAHDELVTGSPASRLIQLALRSAARLGAAREREQAREARLSEIRELERRVALSDRMTSIGTLASGLAHEINNPLTYVLGNLEIVLAGLDGGVAPEVLEMLREAQRGATRVSEIVRSMRIFSRSAPVTAKTAHVDRVVESVLAMVKNEIRHHARLDKQLGAPPLAVANEPMLVQAVLNLLMNAVQAIPEGQVDRYEIAVATGVDPEGRIFIEVRDTGEGMTPETMRRMFDPFFTTKEVGRGMGLGLSLVHSAVTACGGDIAVSSTLGRGSTFRILLPVAVVDPVAPPSVSVAPPLMRGQILIVDDEAPVVRMLRRFLVRDYDVLVAASGREALQILREHPEIEVVLCDVMMPDLSGSDLHRQVARESPALAERFVFVTGGAFGERARAYLHGTMQPTVAKPFRNADVLAAIDRVRGREAREPEAGQDAERTRHAS